MLPQGSDGFRVSFSAVRPPPMVGGSISSTQIKTCHVETCGRGVLARGRVTSTSYELTRIRYNWWELGTKMANFVLSCQIVLIPYLIPRFSHNHQEIFTIVPYSTLIPEAIFHQEGYCRNCTVFHLVFPRLTHIFLYIFIVKYIHNILSLIPY